MEKTTKDPLETRLNYLSRTIKQKNDNKNCLSKEVEATKSEIKIILNTLNLTEFIGDTGTTLSLSEIDKTTLNEEFTIKYLKDKGLNQFVHTKEYFDETELAMAVARGEVNPVDLAPFRIEKKEIRLIIK